MIFGTPVIVRSKVGLLMANCLFGTKLKQPSSTSAPVYISLVRIKPASAQCNGIVSSKHKACRIKGCKGVVWAPHCVGHFFVSNFICYQEHPFSIRKLVLFEAHTHPALYKSKNKDATKICCDCSVLGLVKQWWFVSYINGRNDNSNDIVIIDDKLWNSVTSHTLSKMRIWIEVLTSIGFCRGPTMHHFVTEMCTHVHISVTKWCIVGYWTGALWDLHTRSSSMY